MIISFSVDLQSTSAPSTPIYWRWYFTALIRIQTKYKNSTVGYEGGRIHKWMKEWNIEFRTRQTFLWDLVYSYLEVGKMNSFSFYPHPTTNIKERLLRGVAARGFEHRFLSYGTVLGITNSLLGRLIWMTERYQHSADIYIRWNKSDGLVKSPILTIVRDPDYRM